MRSFLRRLRLVACAVLAAVVGGCAVITPPAPSDFVGAAGLTGSPEIAAYEAQMSAVLAAYDLQRLRYLAGLPDDPGLAEPEWLGPVTGPIRDQADALGAARILPFADLTPGPQIWPGRWRGAQAVMVLTDGPSVQGVPFRLPDQNSLTRELVFRSIATTEARIEAECDDTVRLTYPGDSGERPAGTPFAFVVPAGERDRTSITLPGEGGGCRLSIGYRGQMPRHVDVIGESAADPAIAALDQRFDVCLEPTPERLDPLQAAFFAGRWMSQTCAMDVGDPVLLESSRDGYNAKIEALTGARLPDSAFDEGNPDVPLDFSNAPQLDVIWLSYLDIKADFSGAIMERALRYHAERGTQIRVLVSEVLELPLDLAMWERLAAEFPNVQLQLFTWTAPDHAPSIGRLDSLHRVNHVKMFVTLARDESRSRAIVGGRNIHDGFLFSQSLDLSAWPELQQYGVPGELSLRYFSTYKDFEIEIRTPEAVRTLAAHLGSYWQRDERTSLMRPFSVGTTGPGSGSVPLTGARHFISVPFLDNRALERTWVDLIDAAGSKVEIVTPYLNPTPAIEAALERAMARGVEVTIAARVMLYGDLGGRLMTEMNALFVERYATRMRLFEFQQPDVVLHSKMLMIDERLSVVSSVNLNRRSFLHDTENGVMVLDPAFYRRLHVVFEHYLADSYRLEPDSFAVTPAVRQLFESDWVRDFF
ncbi:MAG: phosphatidylserine/phosphatidylglycerophosphate/cardiolipin synthase family protein [Rubellimicrobium sp.]|nr:phosphatidylserine/phosphatidylglycerophosphate/cardiolipin synthase family protein [Rubellimicrobium sp.]